MRLQRKLSPRVRSQRKLDPRPCPPPAVVDRDVHYQHPKSNWLHKGYVHPNTLTIPLPADGQKLHDSVPLSLRVVPDCGKTHDRLPMTKA